MMPPLWKPRDNFLSDKWLSLFFVSQISPLWTCDFVLLITRSEVWNDPPLCWPRDNFCCDKELSLFFVPRLARYEPPTTRYEPATLRVKEVLGRERVASALLLSWRWVYVPMVRLMSLCLMINDLTLIHHINMKAGLAVGSKFYFCRTLIMTQTQ